jgi:hypothetical protein
MLTDHLEEGEVIISSENMKPIDFVHEKNWFKITVIISFASKLHKTPKDERSKYKAISLYFYFAKYFSSFFCEKGICNKEA